MTSELALLQPGDTVRTWGVLVRGEEGDWFQPPLAVPAVMHDPLRVGPHWSDGAVPVLGADFASLNRPSAAGSRVVGGSRVTGRWTGEAVEVVEQSTDPAPHEVGPDLVTPPCPPPLGGDWPTGTDEDLRCDYGELRRSGAIVTETPFHPSPSQAVLVVAAADVAATEARLRPQLGDRLCVVPSRCANDDLERVQAEIDANWRGWRVYQSGTDPDEQGQLTLHVCLVRLLPEVLEWVASTPVGLVRLRPWLTPMRDG